MAQQLIKYSEVENECTNLKNIAEEVNEVYEKGSTITGYVGTDGSAWKGDASEAYKSAIETFWNHTANAKNALASASLFIASCVDGYQSMDKTAYNSLVDLVGGASALEDYASNTKLTSLRGRWSNIYIDPETGVSVKDMDTAPISNEYADSGNSSSSPVGQHSKPSSSGGNYNNYDNWGWGKDSGSNSNWGSGGNWSWGKDNSSNSNWSSDDDWGGGNSSWGNNNIFGESSIPFAGEKEVRDRYGKDTEHRKTSTRNTYTPIAGGIAIAIPASIAQGGYTMTGYETYIGSGNPTNWDEDSNQGEVNEIWRQQGRNYTNGIATVNVNGTDRYLVAVAPTFGNAGDIIDITFDDGTTIPCVIADTKNTSDANYTAYGHMNEDGKINVLEFEVDSEAVSNEYRDNPRSDLWPLDWDSDSNVTEITNHGSILEADSDGTTIIIKELDSDYNNKPSEKAGVDKSVYENNHWEESTDSYGAHSHGDDDEQYAHLWNEYSQEHSEHYKEPNVYEETLESSTPPWVEDGDYNSGEWNSTSWAEDNNTESLESTTPPWVEDGDYNSGEWNSTSWAEDNNAGSLESTTPPWSDENQ